MYSGSVTLDHLKLFRDIAQARSMSRGAQMNGISQSAASQHIQELERDFELVLLDRSTRPLAITAAGKRYLEFCRDVLRRRDSFDSELQNLKQAVSGEVQIGRAHV